MLRYLRIAVTALSLTACVLLIVLWVRSYWWIDFIDIPSGQRHVGVALIPGHVWWYVYDTPSGWRLDSWTVEGYDRAVKAAGNTGGELVTGFRFESNIGWLPYWFLIVVTTALMAMPWIKWRFSLRTLLIALTLVVVALGIFVAAK